MKKIKNWKVIKDGLNFFEIEKIFYTKKVDEKSYLTLAIRIGNHMYVVGETNLMTTPFYGSEVLSNDWEVLVPDTDEEAKCEKIRRMMKDSCCSGLTNAKIDNLTIPEMYQWISDHLNNDQMYRMLLAYYENQIYKTK